MRETSDQTRLEIKEAKWTAFIVFIILGIGLFLLSCKNQSYLNEKFVIEDKGSYESKFFLLNKINSSLYTVITEENFQYHENLWWDRLYYSKGIGDTIQLEAINKKKFWTKIHEKRFN